MPVVNYNIISFKPFLMLVTDDGDFAVRAKLFRNYIAAKQEVFLVAADLLKFLVLKRSRFMESYEMWQ